MGGSPRRAKPQPRQEAVAPEGAREEVAKTTAPAKTQDPQNLRKPRSRTRGGLSLNFMEIDEDNAGNVNLRGQLGGVRNPLGGDRS
jgi:hypothetical protein